VEKTRNSKLDAILRPVYNFRDEEEEGSQSDLQQQNALSDAPRRHSMALCDVTRVWYSLLLLVVGLLILVTAEMFVTKEQRSAVTEPTGSRTVLFLRELCSQPQVNITRLEELTAQFIAWVDDGDPIQVDVVSKSGRFCVFLSSRTICFKRINVTDNCFKYFSIW
jgi:hypothetical protein